MLHYMMTAPLASERSDLERVRTELQALEAVNSEKNYVLSRTYIAGGMKFKAFVEIYCFC